MAKYALLQTYVLIIMKEIGMKFLNLKILVIILLFVQMMYA